MLYTCSHECEITCTILIACPTLEVGQCMDRVNVEIVVFFCYIHICECHICLVLACLAEYRVFLSWATTDLCWISRDREQTVVKGAEDGPGVYYVIFSWMSCYIPCCWHGVCLADGGIGRVFMTTFVVEMFACYFPRFSHYAQYGIFISRHFCYYAYTTWFHVAVVVYAIGPTLNCHSISIAMIAGCIIPIIRTSINNTQHCAADNRFYQFLFIRVQPCTGIWTISSLTSYVNTSMWFCFRNTNIIPNLWRRTRHVNRRTYTSIILHNPMLCSIIIEWPYGPLCCVCERWRHKYHRTC